MTRKEYDAKYYQENKEYLSKRQRERRKKLREENPFIENLRTTKANCKKFGIPFDITYKDLIVPEKCIYLDIPLEWSSTGITMATPSIDRIDPSKGYVKENIQIISYMANAMKYRATEKQLLTFAENVLKLHNKS